MVRLRAIGRFLEDRAGEGVTVSGAINLAERAAAGSRVATELGFVSDDSKVDAPLGCRAAAEGSGCTVLMLGDADKEARLPSPRTSVAVFAPVHRQASLPGELLAAVQGLHGVARTEGCSAPRGYCRRSIPTSGRTR